MFACSMSVPAPSASDLAPLIDQLAQHIV